MAGARSFHGVPRLSFCRKKLFAMCIETNMPNAFWTLRPKGVLNERRTVSMFFSKRSKKLAGILPGMPIPPLTFFVGAEIESNNPIETRRSFNSFFTEFNGAARPLGLYCVRDL